MTAVLGADPGVRGGLAVVVNGVVSWTAAFRPDMTREALATLIAVGAGHLFQRGGTVAFLERVNSRPGEGHVGAFTFGRSYGGLEQGLLARGVIVRDTYPQIWQSAMGCLTGGNKNVSKRRAEEVFDGQGVHFTHAISDACLIAEYGRRLIDGI